MADRDRKALFRAKLNERQQKKRIDSPVVRYNENDRPVCRVCDVVLKSDSDWILHQASRKHHEATNNLKASASEKAAVDVAKFETSREPPRHQGRDSQRLNDAKQDKGSNVQKPRSASALPPNFFDNQESKRQKAGSDINSNPSKVARSNQDEIQPRRICENVIADTGAKQNSGALLVSFFDDKEAGMRQSKGALPEGFFDNKEADLRARGIEAIKPDVKDEYKEFEKLIQVDLAEVDNRLEAEEIDAAEMIEEEEMVEQRTYRDRVEFLKRKKLVMAARTLKNSKASQAIATKSNEDESSSEEDDDESFYVDWRAQHL